MFDTIKGGDYLVDQDAAEILAREAIETVIELEHMGLPFNRTPDGRIDQRRFGGHTRNYGEAPVKRSCFAADRTGHMILQTLYQQCLKAGVKFYDALQIFKRLVNIGDAKSLAAHPASTTHRQMTEEEQKQAGVTPDMIRLCVGIEAIDDILADLAQALDAAR